MVGYLVCWWQCQRQEEVPDSGGAQEDHPLGSFYGWALGTVAVLRGLHGASVARVPWKETWLEGLEEDGTNVDITDW